MKHLLLPALIALRYIWTGFALVVLVSGVFVGLITEVTAASSGSAPVGPWAAPPAPGLRRAGSISSEQHRSVFLPNVDCRLLSYRRFDEATMRSGCLISGSAGMYNSADGTIILDGTDEAIPLRLTNSNRVVILTPHSFTLTSLAASSLGGSYVGMYYHPSDAIHDYHNLGQLTAKEITAAPDVTFRDGKGQPLTIQSDTLSFSGDGNWLVALGYDAAFVRINIYTQAMTVFAQPPAAHGDVSLSAIWTALSHDGRYAAIGNHVTGSLKIYDLNTCGAAPTGTNYVLPVQPCSFNEYMPFIRQQVPDVLKVQGIRFLNNDLISFELTAQNPAHSGVYIMSPSGAVTSLIEYMGLGDSYSSGEGAFTYADGTDTTNNRCHLSARSYPLLLSRDLFAGSGQSVACSGAVIRDVGSQNPDYRGQARGAPSYKELQQSQPAQLTSILDRFKPGYIAQHHFVARHQPRILTVSVGGNDIGFGNILASCVTPQLGGAGANTCFRSYEDRRELLNLIDRTKPKWVDLFRQLRTEAPLAAVYAIGYPQIADPAGRCSLNVHLNQSELLLSQLLIDYLNGTIQAAADEAGVYYLSIRDALSGHRLCEASGSQVAINGLTAGNDSGAVGINFLGRESYHPNALGHQLIEQAIIRGLGTAAGAPAASASQTQLATNLLNAPKTGRAIVRRTPVGTLLTASAQTRSFSLNAGTDDQPLKPSAAYSVRLDGPIGRLLTTVNSTSTGTLTAAITLPADIAAGIHTIDLVGLNPLDTTVALTQPVLVRSNNEGACKGIAASFTDVDRDGIDDSCDPVIGEPPADPSAAVISPADIILPAGSPPLLKAPPTLLSVTSAPIPGTFASTGLSVDPPASNSVPLINRATGTSVPAPTQPPGNPDLKPVRQRNPLMLWGMLSLMAAAVPALLSTKPIRPARLMHSRKRFRSHSKVTKSIQTHLKIDYTRRMNWLRKTFAYLFAAVLLALLLGGTLATGFTRTFGGADNLKTWLADSHIYDRVVTNTLDEAQSSGQADSSIPLNNQQIRQVAKEVFTDQLVQQSANTFIDANYAWLKGKTAQPEFTIDLTKQKQTFAQKAGQTVQSKLASLPTCTAEQLAQLQIPIDPLAINCRPGTLDPATEGNRVTQEISSSDFLSQPVITPATLGQLNPEKQPGDSEPYYQSLSRAPQAYQLLSKLPWICLGLAAITAAIIWLLAPVKRHGLRLIGVIFTAAGALLLITKFISDSAVEQLNNKIVGSTAGEIHQPYQDFLAKVEASLAQSYLFFGIAFLVIAAIIFGYLIITRNRKNTSRSTGKQASEAQAPNAPHASPAASSDSPATPNTDGLIGGASTRNQPSAPPIKPGQPAPPIKKRSPRPPRLVQ